jgi:hypothetical protein
VKKKEKLLKEALTTVGMFERVVKAYQTADLRQFIDAYPDVAQTILKCLLDKDVSIEAFLARLPEEWLEAERLLEVVPIFQKFVDEAKQAQTDLESKKTGLPTPPKPAAPKSTRSKKSRHSEPKAKPKAEPKPQTDFSALKAIRLLKRSKLLSDFVASCGGRDQAQGALNAARAYFDGSMAEVARKTRHNNNNLWSWHTQLNKRASKPKRKKKDVPPPEDIPSRSDVISKFKAAGGPSGMIQQCGGAAEALAFFERAVHVFGSVPKLGKATGYDAGNLYVWKSNFKKLAKKASSKDDKKPGGRQSAFDQDMMRAFQSVESGKKAIIAIMKEETREGKRGLLARVARKLRQDHTFTSISEATIGVAFRSRGLHPDQLEDQLSFPTDTPPTDDDQNQLQEALDSAVSKNRISEVQAQKLKGIAEGFPDSSSPEELFDAILKQHARDQGRAAQFLVERGVIPAAGRDGINFANLRSRLIG